MARDTGFKFKIQSKDGAVTNVVVSCPDRSAVRGVIDVVVIGEKGAGKSQLITAMKNRLGLNPPSNAGLTQEELTFNQELLDLAHTPMGAGAKAGGQIKHYVTTGQLDFVFKSFGTRIRMLLGNRSTCVTFVIASLASILCVFGGGFMLLNSEMVVVRNLAAPIGLGAVVLGAILWPLVFSMLMRQQSNDQIEVVFWDIPGGDIIDTRLEGTGHNESAIGGRLAVLFNDLDEYRRKLKTPHAMAFVIVVNPLQHAAIQVGDKRQYFSSLEGLCSFVDSLYPMFEKHNFSDVLVVINRHALLKRVNQLVEDNLLDREDDVEVFNVPIDNQGRKVDTTRILRYLESTDKLLGCLEPQIHFTNTDWDHLFFEAGTPSEEGCCFDSGGDDDSGDCIEWPEGFDPDEGAPFDQYAHPRILYKYNEKPQGFDDDAWALLQKWLLSAFIKRTKFAAPAAERQAPARVEPADLPLDQTAPAWQDDTPINPVDANDKPRPVLFDGDATAESKGTAGGRPAYRLPDQKGTSNKE